MGIYGKIIPILGEEIGVGRFRGTDTPVFAGVFPLDQHGKGAGNMHLKYRVSLQHFLQLMENARSSIFKFICSWSYEFSRFFRIREPHFCCKC